MRYLLSTGAYRLVVCTSIMVGSLGSFAQLVTNRAKLVAFSQLKETEATLSQKEAVQEALKKNIPIRRVLSDGNVMELQAFENGVPVYYITQNKNSAATISTNKVYPGAGFGFNLTGTGQRLAIWDEGAVRTDHVELTGRVTIKDGTSYNSSHGTHVGGTMIATGISAQAKGMAYKASLDSYNWSFDLSEMSTAAANGIRVSNHSYGQYAGWSGTTWGGNTTISTVEDYKFGFYSSKARDVDQIAFDAPYYLVVKAAGNDRGEGTATQGHEIDGGPDGYDCLSDMAIAKNVLTVGAVDDLPNGYQNAAGVKLYSLSSWGPTDDGRIKPDIMANGMGLTSTGESSTTAYNTLSGTSMATPSVSGSIGLLLEHQANLNGSGVMRAATMKGLLIHTADEAGPANGPDYMYGWGLMNTYRAANLMSKSKDACIKSIREYTIGTGQTLVVNVTKKSFESLKATLSWTDPAGTPVSFALNPRNRMLVNDLDLRIIGPVTYYPWTLNVANPSWAASTGDNIVDNVEQIEISGLQSNVYTITVSSKGNLVGGTQAFSLIISGHEDVSAYVQNVVGTISNRYLAQGINNLTFINATATASADVIANAGNFIDFKPNTIFYPGSRLEARIRPVCNISGTQFRTEEEAGLMAQEDFAIVDDNTAPYSEEVPYIHPNPISTGTLYFGRTVDSFELVNNAGQVLKSGTDADQVDITGFSKGLYLLKIGDHTQKVIVR